jgi:hypothetical protein
MSNEDTCMSRAATSQPRDARKCDTVLHRSDQMKGLTTGPIVI